MKVFEVEFHKIKIQKYNAARPSKTETLLAINIEQESANNINIDDVQLTFKILKLVDRRMELKKYFLMN